MADKVRADIIALDREVIGDDGHSRLPATLDEVVTIAERTEGVRLSELITTLGPGRRGAEATLARILATASMPASRDTIERHLQESEP